MLEYNLVIAGIPEIINALLFLQINHVWLKNHSVVLSTPEVDSNIDVVFDGASLLESKWEVYNLNVIIGHSDVHMTNLSVYHNNTKGIISIDNTNLGFVQVVGCKVVLSNCYINGMMWFPTTFLKVTASVVDIRGWNFLDYGEASVKVVLEAISSDVTIRDSQFIRMDSVNLVSVSYGSRLFLMNTSFIQNNVYGGTVYALRNCLVEIINCSFVENFGLYGLDMEQNITLKMEGSTFVNNVAIHSEGAANRLLLHRNVFENTSISAVSG